MNEEEIQDLWRATRAYRKFPHEQVNVRFVSKEEIQRLNAHYRGKDKPTNVLTFSYDGEHDVAVCLEVAEGEARERGVRRRDYVARLLTHAFLHATGMDHERSAQAARQMEAAEAEILKRCGYRSVSLS